MASTFPLEVVAAARWVEEPANKSLSGDALVAALQPEPTHVAPQSDQFLSLRTGRRLSLLPADLAAIGLGNPVAETPAHRRDGSWA